MPATVEIDDETLAAARAVAAERDISLGTAVTELVRGSLQDSSSSGEDGADLPGFGVPADEAASEAEKVKGLAPSDGPVRRRRAWPGYRFSILAS
jgi:hypothetical protein